MNCRECLEELATGSLRELTPDSSVSRHAAACPDCGPLLTQLRDREYQAATILNNLRPLSDPITVAGTAGTLARRHRIGRVVVTLTAIALGLTIWFAADTMVSDFGGKGFNVPMLRTETMSLSCLTPEQAGEIISPYVRSNGSTYYVPPAGVSAITVRATPTELAQVRNLLRDFDNDRNASCHLNTGPGPDFTELQRQLKALEKLQPVLAGTKASPAATKPDNPKNK
ncbi:MAG TPA: hypothetical protein VFP26_08890 [Gemmatimonadaceae bacterium]|nr:hypothetical protein [Gemmatimonadaceae bacterium]